MKNLKIKTIILGIIATTLLIGSCKKYEDNPVISLRSKNKRLIGEWELVGMESKSIDVYTYYGEGEKYNESSSFYGDKLTVSYDIESSWYDTTVSESYSYYSTLTIEKEGNYRYHTEVSDTTSSNTNGNWSWMDGTSSKEQILLDLDGVYSIQKLTNEELVLKEEAGYSDEEGSNSYEESTETTLTFEKKK